MKFFSRLADWCVIIGAGAFTCIPVYFWLEAMLTGSEW